MIQLIEFILKFDEHLDRLAGDFGPWTYALLAAIIFCETGLVFTPILPGDSLLFAVGAFCARPAGELDCVIVTSDVANTGTADDSTPYTLGKCLRPKVLDSKLHWLNQKHLDR